MRPYVNKWTYLDSDTILLPWTQAASSPLTEYAKSASDIKLARAQPLYPLRITIIEKSSRFPVQTSLVVIHFNWPKQMRKRELGHLPLAVFLDIYLSHHKRIRDFTSTDHRLQINVI